MQRAAVVVLGDGTSGLAELLVERGAASVFVYDPVPERAARVAPVGRIRVEAFRFEQTQIQGFDLAIVEDLGAFSEPRAVMELVRRGLTKRGIALVGCDNADSATRLAPASERAATVVDYYSLYDLAAAQFRVVRMLGQAPFVGYAVAVLGPDEEPTPVVDTSLLPGGAEVPERFWALCSTEPVRIEDFSVVQLPVAGLSVQAPSRPVESSEELARAQQELEALKVERDAATAQRDALKADCDALKAEREHAEAELSRLRAEMAAATQARELAQEQVTVLEQKLSDERSAFARRLADREAEFARASSLAQAELESEHARMEQQLSELSSRNQELARLLANAQQVGRALAMEAERSAAATALEARSAELAAAHHRLAQREADLQAALWSIEVLEQRVGKLGSVAGSHGAEAQQRQAVLSHQVRSQGQ